jgi:hypothetical protein
MGDTQPVTEVRVRLSGEHAELGQVPAGDVARLILEVERALARAAYVVLGRPRRQTGRYEQAIESAIRLRLSGLEAGSVVSVLELPALPEPDDAALALDAESLGEAALDALLRAAADPKVDQADPYLAEAVLELADRLYIGERYDAVTIEARSERPRTRRVARIDHDVRARLREVVDDSTFTPVHRDTVVGVLVEADFERCTARLRGALRQAVDVRFTPNQADEIQAALREPATLQGEVTYDPRDHVVRSVTLRRIVRGEQMTLDLDPDEFWRERSFDELAVMQATNEPVHVETLHDAEASEEERDAFMAALAELDE